MPENDAQKEETDQSEEPLEDMTPEKDATGGRAQLSANVSPDAQKKEITDV